MKKDMLGLGLRGLGVSGLGLLGFRLSHSHKQARLLMGLGFRGLAVQGFGESSADARVGAQPQELAPTKPTIETLLQQASFARNYCRKQCTTHDCATPHNAYL